jgi:tetratricopeptide (TPR) repeat protein/DNA-binding CsgD family transcriptional regulator
MKSLFLSLTFILLTLSGQRSYAQRHSKTQIDSLLDVADTSHDFQTGLKLATIAHAASKLIKYNNGEVRALLIASAKYNNARQFEMSFKYAVAADSSMGEIKSPLSASSILFQKGICYNNLGFFKEGKESLTQAIPVAQDIPEGDQKHNRLGQIYSALAQYNTFPEAVVLYKKAYAEFLQTRKPVKIGGIEECASNLGCAYFLHQQYDSAGFYLQKAITLAIANKDTIILAAAYDNIGSLYFEKKDYKLSETYFQKALALNQKVRNTDLESDALGYLAKIYINLNEGAKAAKYLARSAALKDSLNAVAKRAVKTPLNYIIKYKEQQLAVSRRRYLIIIATICFLSLLIVWAGYQLYRRTRKKLRLTTEKMNELIAKIELSEDKKSQEKMEELKSVVQLAVSNDPAFLTKFTEYDPAFSRRLLSLARSLVAVELELCAMLKLNFETKEIARYTKMSVRSVESKKYRIRKKLNIPSDHDINTWMIHF